MCYNELLQYRMNRQYVFYSALAAGSSGGTFVLPVELAAEWYFCNKKISAYIFDKSEKKKLKKLADICEVDLRLIRPDEKLRVTVSTTIVTLMLLVTLLCMVLFGARVDKVH